MGGMPNNMETKEPMSIENPIGPQYETIEDITRESVSESAATGDLRIIPQPSESHDQLPRLPLKRKRSGPAPPVQISPRPLGAIATLAIEFLQSGDPKNHRKASVDGARVNASQQWQERRDNPPPLHPRARRPSELDDPSTPLPEANTPQSRYPPAISEPRVRVYGNMQSSELGDLSTHLPEMDMPQTITPPTFPEQTGRLYWQCTDNRC